MNFFQIDLRETLIVSMLDKECFNGERRHCTRVTDEHIIYFVASGSLRLLVDGEELVLREKDVYFFPKGCHQEPIGRSECTFYYIHFFNDNVRELSLSMDEYGTMIAEKRAGFAKANLYGAESYAFLKPTIRQRLHISSESVWMAFVEQLQKNVIVYGNNTPSWRFRVSCTVANILMQLEDLAVIENREGGFELSPKGQHTVQQIENYIGRNYRLSFGSTEIEKAFLIDYDYANRLFKRCFGCGIIQYRNRLRIYTAKVLLVTTEKSMQQIADDVGFHDRYYFCRFFKKETGISPTKYRETEMRR